MGGVDIATFGNEGAAILMPEPDPAATRAELQSRLERSRRRRGDHLKELDKWTGRADSKQETEVPDDR
jgi:hypothetical protein